MWKGPTLAMDLHYPFLPAEKKHLVKKRMAKTEKQVERARLLASLRHDCLIKLESAAEEKGEYYLLFEHVDTPLDKWSQTVTREFIEEYERQLIMFSRYLADKSIITSFRKEHMGVSQAGYPKYFLDPRFEVEPQVEKIALKKKYKEEIRKEMQYIFDKKGSSKPTTNADIPHRKENAKILKILEALEKGKANLCSEQPREPHSSEALVSPQTIQTLESKGTLRPIKNMHNVMIQKEVNKVNKIQLIVNNKAVETLQQEFKREYASSSFYINGLPTVVLEKEGETKRLLSPGDKFARFEEVKYKEYKSMKTSGEGYVQDFINVLEGNDPDKITAPGSPRSTLKGTPKIALPTSLRTSITNGPKSPSSKQLTNLPSKLAIEADSKSPKSPKSKLSRPPELKMEEERIMSSNEIKRAVSPRGDSKRSNLYLS